MFPPPSRSVISLVCSAVAAALLSGLARAELALNKDDHIALIGNGVPDRMQHHGWLETLITARFPNHDLVFRNLGFSGDEIGGFLDNAAKSDAVLRNRSENFGSNDDWLKKAKADVVLAFFGFNESFAGDAGLPKFRNDLATFIKETKGKNYSGKGAPRLVLFGPLAAESTNDPNLSDAGKLNANLQRYSAAMAEVAMANNVPFVDLFALSQQAYAGAAKKNQRLTFNAIHLTEAGDKALAPEIFRALFGETAPAGDLETLRLAINDKNFEWYARYRTVDGFNVYGGRSKLEFGAAVKTGQTESEGPEGKSKRSPLDPNAPKISNYKVMQDEMSQRDVKTANRDKRVWALARGGGLKVDDSNLPPVTEVAPNRADVQPYLAGTAAIKKMTVAKGTKVTLFADEKMFPELVNPVQMAWDTKGRLWVAAWPSYPEVKPTDAVKDKLLIFEDTNNDGVADKCIHFLDNLNCPTGFQFYKDGVLVVQAPNLLWVRDTNGDDKPDSVERVLMGIDSADSHHTSNALVLDPGGATYLSDGVFHRAQTETAAGVVRNIDGAIFRYEPLTHKYERYVAYGFANPHGRVFDFWGNDIVTDATGNANYFAPAFSGHIDFPAKHPGMNQFWKRPSRPCPGTGMLSSRHFPDDWQGNFLNCNVIGFRGIFRVKVSEEGSGLAGESLEDLVKSEDENFRPAAVGCAPDGSIYFLDWAQQLIGHMQHHIRDPNRDHQHGRIYRMTYEGRPLLKPPQIHGASIEALLDLLKEPENDTRTRAKIELGKHDTGNVIAAVNAWVRKLDPKDPAYEHHMMEALWVHQWHNVVNQELLKRMLRSPDHRARAAATRVLCYQRDRVSDALALLKVQAADTHPRVRLETVRTASFFNGKDVPAAMDVASTILKQSTDYYLDYTFKETHRQLQSLSDDVILPTDQQVLAAFVGTLSDGELKKARESEPVLFERIARRSIDLGARDKAVEKLMTLNKADRTGVLLAALQRIDGKGDVSKSAIPDVTLLLATVPALELAKSRDALLALAQNARLAPVRRAAWAGVITAEGKPEAIWSDANTKDATRIGMLDCIGALQDPVLRGKFQPLLLAALNNPKTAGNLRTAVLRALPLTGPDFAAANFATLATALGEGRDRVTAASAIKQLPRESWDKAAAGPAAESILAWARTVPADKRTAQDFIETVQAGAELASLLPPADAARISKELRSLGVSVFVIKTVQEQMRYDTTRLVVEAGKPFEILFENTDVMPHNLVVVQPGAREEVGRQAEAMDLQPDKEGRIYIPKNNKIINATRMLEPGQKATLKLVAPKKEGDYEYVCTFPGHYLVMFGQFVVTKDVDAYLQKHPQAATPRADAAPDHSQHGKKHQ